jgi:RHS repeat-associated protein
MAFLRPSNQYPQTVPLVEEAIQQTKQLLSQQAAQPAFMTKLLKVFGADWDSGLLGKILEAWAVNDFTGLPLVEVRSQDELQGAKGAYAAERNTIYLSQTFLAQNTNNIALAVEILLEEIGHFLDQQLNESDSPGDEGAIFAAVVQGKALSTQQLAALKAENDQAVIELDGETVTIEKNDNPPEPDLVISDAFFPAVITTGDRYSFFAEVTNQGSSAADPGTSWFSHSVYFSVNEELDAGDTYLGGSFTNALQPGESQTVVSYLNKFDYFPSSISPGAYNLLFVADSNNIVSEGNEANNILVLPLEVFANSTASQEFLEIEADGSFLQGDLSINDQTISAYPNRFFDNYLVTDLSIGSALEVFVYSSDFIPKVEVLNLDDWIGQADTFRTVTESYGPDPFSNEPRYETVVSFLPNLTNPYSFDDYYTNNESDRYLIRVSSFQDNQLGGYSLSIENEQSYPFFDLEIGGVEPYIEGYLGEAATVYSGTSTELNWAIGIEYESGTDLWEFPISVGIYYSSDLNFDPNEDTFLEFGDSYYIDIYGENEASAVGTTNLTIPLEEEPGTGFLFIIADHLHSIPETEEDNNVQVIPINLLSPPVLADLIGTQINTPDTVGLGDNINVSWSVSNQGDGSVENPWIDALYLSKDTSLDTTDRALTGVQVTQVLPLLPGESYTTTREINLPNNLDSGDYHFLLIADASSSISESDEVNNVLTQPVTLTAPDLVPQADLENIVFDLGDTVTIDWSVINQGTVPARATSWQDQVYISDDELLDPTDTLLRTTEYSNTSSLLPGESYGIQQTFLIPNDTTPGDRFLLLTADVQKDQGETDYSNNTQAIPIQLRGPDLAIISADLPESVEEEELVTLSWIVQNQGPVPVLSQTWEDHVYLSEDLVWDSSDRLVTSYTVQLPERLQPNEQYEAQIDTLIPAVSSDMREQHFLIVSDANANQGDINRDNNVFSNPVYLEQETIVISELLTVAAGETLTFGPGTVIKFTNSLAGINVQGTLNIQGSLKNPVVLTSWLDDSIGGESNDDGNASLPAAGDWSGIKFEGASASGNLENVKIRYADQAIEGRNGARINLSNTALTENNFGVYVYSPLVEVNADNLLVARNENTGIFMRADSRGIYRNATVTDNGFSGSGWHGAGIHLGGANLTVENSIVAFNNDGLHHQGDPPLTNFNHTIFYNPDGEEIIWNDDPNQPDLTQNGNRVVDPLFIDRQAGNYQLATGSPAIDAGQGTNAPGQDLLGQGRVDDAGVANTGSGNPKYVDLGVYEYQGESQTADLTITQVANPSPSLLTPGKAFSSSYTVTNLGEASAAGGWSDRVYLSSDRFVSPDDKLVAIQTQNGVLAPGESYTEILDITIPNNIAGPQYLLVTTDSNQAVAESNESNNTQSASQTLSVDLPQLTLDDSVTGEVRQGKWSFFQFEVEAGTPIRISLDSTTRALALYSQFGSTPDALNFDILAAVPGSPDQELRILDPQSGTYYFGVYGQSVSGVVAPIILSAEVTQPTLYDVTQSEVTNGGLVTLEIIGDNLSANDLVQLVAADGTSLIPVSVVNDDPTRSYATFDLAGVSVGAYDLSVQFFGGPLLTLADEITVGDASVTPMVFSPFYADLETPSAMRPGREVKVVLEYGNNPDDAEIKDITSPLITIESNQELEWQLPGTGEWIPGNSISLLGLSSSGTTNILRPNQQEELEFKIRTPFSTGNIDFTVYAVGASADDGSSEAIDWDSLEADSRLPGMSDEAWAAVWDNVEAQTGDTWGDFVAMLGDNAAYLDRLGQSVYDTANLFAFEVLQANGLNPNPYLAAAQDAFTPAPGLSLSFSRVYGSALSSRYEAGVLGRGWTHNHDLYLEAQPNGDILAHGADGSLRMFASDGEGGYVSSSAEDGVLVANGDGTFTLRSQSGTRFNFRSDLRLGSIIDPNGTTISASYNGGNLAELNHSAGQTFNFEYGTNGLISRVVDQDGQEALYTYDASGEHLTEVTNFNGRVTTYTYDANSHSLLTVSNEAGNQLTYNYDGFNRLASASLNNGAEKLTYSYDTAGTVTVTDGEGNHANLHFDHRGIPVKIEDPTGVAYQFGVDGNNNPTQINRSDGADSNIVYDENGNPFQITNAAGNTISLKFDETYNNLLWIQDARGNTTRYDYDGAGNLARITYPDGSAERFEVDDAGNLIGYTNRRGNEFSYINNEDGLLVSQTNPDGSKVNYVYTPQGYLLSATDNHGTVNLSYDDNNQITQISYPNGHFLIYSYDAAGRRTQMVDQDGVTTNYIYDTVGRLSRLTDSNDNLVVQYTYDVVGRLSREDKGNGTYTTHIYDEIGQLTSLNHYATDGSLNYKCDYTYNSLGQQTEAKMLQGIWSYEYDATGQLTHAIFSSNNASIPSQDLAYIYDEVGNRIRTYENGTVTEYTTNGLNQYETAGEVVYEYDDNGNLISKIDGGEHWDYHYDYADRLTHIIEPNGTLTEYKYDVFGNRISKISGEQRIDYLIDPLSSNVVGEYFENRAFNTYYMHGIGLEAEFGVDGIVSYYNFDILGSSIGLTNTSGNFEKSYQYLPFGDVSADIEVIQSPFGYVGQWGVMFESNDLYFMGARYYDSNTGKFITPDPIGLAGGSTNIYSYVANNPILFFDSQGLEKIKSYTPEQAKEALNYLIQYEKDHGTWKAIRDLNPTFGKDQFKLRNLDQGEITSDLGGVDLDWLMTIAAAVNVAEIALPSVLNPVGSLSPPSSPLAYSIGKILWNFIDEDDHLHTFGNRAELNAVVMASLLEQGFTLKQIFDRYNVRVIGSATPEDKFGPVGYDEPNTLPGEEKRYISPDETFHYRIDFWNDPDAEVPTQTAIIRDQLDPDLDWDTLNFTNFGFLDWNIDLPGGQTIDTRVDMRPHFELAVDVDATFNPDTGEIEWYFQAVDPITGDLNDVDPFAGFLPPFNEATEYELGWVEFTVDLKADLATGTEVTNQAFVQFDLVNAFNPAPKEGPWLNTIDADAPESAVEALPDTSTSENFEVTWAGTDLGSGIATYDIYVSENGGIPTLWLDDSPENAAIYTGTNGSTYAFYSIATDNVGNTEAAPTAADATTTVLAGPVVIATAFDVTNDHVLLGQADLTFTLQNQGNTPLSDVELQVVYSDDDIIGNADDQIVGAYTAADLLIGSSVTDSLTVQLPLDVLNSRAQAETPVSQGSGYVSNNIDYIGLISDTEDVLGIDDITYFPWDIDGSGQVTPSDAIYVINRLGQTTTAENALADFDGSGQITPSDAIAAINRLGYTINSSVTEILV